MRINQCAALIVIFLLMIFFGGCAGGAQTRSDEDFYEAGPKLEASNQWRFDDIPVPAGFSMHRKDSFVFENNQTRMGAMNYIGKAKIGSLIEFYKHNMALNDWELMNSVEFGKAILNFEKNGENCIITLEKIGLRKTFITLSLSPLSEKGVAIRDKKSK